jgi:hypothetical protein
MGNAEEIRKERETEFYELHRRLVEVLSKHGRHGTGEEDSFWIPADVEDFREIYVVFADASLLRSEVLTELKSVLTSCRFIWVLVIHLATRDRSKDDRVLEMTRSETVVLDNSMRSDRLTNLH